MLNLGDERPPKLLTSNIIQSDFLCGTCYIRQPLPLNTHIHNYYTVCAKYAFFELFEIPPHVSVKKCFL